MKHQNILAVALTAVFATGVAGCAPRLSPEEAAVERTRQMQVQTKVYPDKRPEDVIKAADRVFRLADDDYELRHRPGGFTAHRRWYMYFVLAGNVGDDFWEIDVKPDGWGSRITAVHSGTNTGLTLAFGAAPTYMDATVEPAVYQLFFARLDRLLYGRKDWITCSDAKRSFTEGSLAPLCRCADDREPDGR